MYNNNNNNNNNNNISNNDNNDDDDSILLSFLPTQFNYSIINLYYPKVTFIILKLFQLKTHQKSTPSYNGNSVFRKNAYIHQNFKKEERKHIFSTNLDFG